MNIALINASPKPKNEKSSSGLLLRVVRGFLPEDADVEELHFRQMTLPDGAPEALEHADVWVFAAPLYVDGLPSHLVSCLSKISDLNTNAAIFGILNCGFYEGEQAKTALQILRNWADRSSNRWCGGIGIGGGGALAALPDTGTRGPRGPVDAACKQLADAASSGKSMGEEYVRIDFPRFLYKLAAQAGWRQSIRKNGGHMRDLGARPSEE